MLAEVLLSLSLIPLEQQTHPFPNPNSYSIPFVERTFPANRSSNIVA